VGQILWLSQRMVIAVLTFSTASAVCWRLFIASVWITIIRLADMELAEEIARAFRSSPTVAIMIDATPEARMERTHSLKSKLVTRTVGMMTAIS